MSGEPSVTAVTAATGFAETTAEPRPYSAVEETQ